MGFEARIAQLQLISDQAALARQEEQQKRLEQQRLRFEAERQSRDAEGAEILNQIHEALVSDPRYHQIVQTMHHPELEEALSYFWKQQGFLQEKTVSGFIRSKTMTTPETGKPNLIRAYPIARLVAHSHELRQIRKIGGVKGTSYYKPGKRIGWIARNDLHNHESPDQVTPEERIQSAINQLLYGGGIFGWLAKPEYTNGTVSIVTGGGISHGGKRAGMTDPIETREHLKSLLIFSYISPETGQLRLFKGRKYESVDELLDHMANTSEAITKNPGYGFVGSDVNYPNEYGILRTGSPNMYPHLINELTEYATY